MDGEGHELVAEGSDFSCAFGGEGVEHFEQALGGSEHFFGRGFVPAEVARIGLAPGVQGEDGAGEIDAADFGKLEIGEKAIFAR